VSSREIIVTLDRCRTWLLGRCSLTVYEREVAISARFEGSLILASFQRDCPAATKSKRPRRSTAQAGRAHPDSRRQRLYALYP